MAIVLHSNHYMHPKCGMELPKLSSAPSFALLFMKQKFTGQKWCCVLTELLLTLTFVANIQTQMKPLGKHLDILISSMHSGVSLKWSL
jgi:hypothetical protein